MVQKKLISVIGKFIIISIPVILILGVLYYYLFYQPPFAVTVDTVKRGKVEQTVSAFASGTVMGSKRAMLASSMIGTVAIVHVKESEYVKKDQILLELNHGDLDAQVELAEANLSVAKTRVEQAKVSYQVSKELAESRLKQAEAQLTQATADYERARKLLEQGILSSGEQEKIELAYRVAHEAYQSALTGLKELSLREQDIKLAEANLVQAEASLKAAISARDKALIRAPFDGMVATVNVREGEGVGMGIPLLYIVDTSDLYVEAPFDEAYAGKLALGQKARVELDAFPGESFQGEIMEISPVINITKEFTRTFNVKVRILEKKDFMPGMSADVTVIVSEKDDVLYVPTESLIRDEYAYRLEGGRAIKTPVKVGIGNWETREILEGLREGQTIITSVGIKGLSDGSRVTVVPSLGE
ncbi:MAG: efflux RND transporter periplasmic adaptor subunit [Candidatus Hydrogenedentes bacterium]|nr:efflux RND transporter periplasmic adaptor subunit [Candidatus Hydrogenedentota bacterium]